MKKLLLLLLIANAAFAQKPIINPGGVLNAASFVPVPLIGHAVAPGSIASIFGRNLAAATLSASSFPLPWAVLAPRASRSTPRW